MTGSAATGGGGPKRGPEALGDILKRVLRESGFADRKSGDEITEVWREIAGPETGSHTSIYAFRSGIVTVAVDSAPLCQELDLFRKEELLDALRQKVRGSYVRELRFRLV